MKYILTITAMVISYLSFGQGSRIQKGYVKRDGTYVQPHYKTNVDKTNHNNYTTTKNYNPYTGTTGSKSKDYTPDAYNYSSDKNVKTGERGGQYYINDRGTKTYVPKRR